ncbi:sorting nexin-31-like [Liolophura sinensis]|uniref:sorting nexin-31-like n=1 Tax=Liolophura sinensis TaxID=3198878 RepID=UPI003158B036
MELSDFQTVEVHTLDKDSPSVKILSKVNNNQLLTTDLHRKVCDTLGLSKSSHGAFALFLGGLTPVRKLRPYDCITLPVTDLTFQKWCFDPKKEKELLKTDANAAHWLFVQALNQVETGKIRPTKPQLQELEECLNPAFCTEKQYVEICHTVEKYFEFCLDNCRLLTEVTCLDHPYRVST